jgi:mRNA interferase RelE/StbE
LAWILELETGAKKDLAKLDKLVAKRILAFLQERVLSGSDPRRHGQALRGSTLGELWKYRVGAYRIICSIEDERLCVLVVAIGNRREIYR